MKRFLGILILFFGLCCGTFAQSSGERILLIGDSMLDGLCRRLQDYADANGHYLRTFIWYGATTRHWATTKDMTYQIAKEHPTLIVFSCGSNDLGYYDLKRREGYVKDIIAMFGKVPYVWVGPEDCACFLQPCSSTATLVSGLLYSPRWLWMGRSTFWDLGSMNGLSLQMK